LRLYFCELSRKIAASASTVPAGIVLALLADKKYEAVGDSVGKTTDRTKEVNQHATRMAAIQEIKMKCDRCERQKRLEYRVFSDIMNVKVCADCAAEARELRLGIEVLDGRNSLQPDEYMLEAS
jgi:hypothetical protein